MDNLNLIFGYLFGFLTALVVRYTFRSRKRFYCIFYPNGVWHAHEESRALTGARRGDRIGPWTGEWFERN